ncbi:MAG TPA: HypC/HybG/HupF family hydrogenase formation chaperone [Acidimicrobiales bacterium]|nr:HypC/HybG/HupF family hydrogenase formation chaperone [Acidimicrobiales bacterium]
MSCLGRVIGSDDPKTVLIEHINGLMSRASLLFFDGPPPEPGEWVVVHSGYVIDRIDADDAVRAVAEIRRGEHLATDASLERVHA